MIESLLNDRLETALRSTQTYYNLSIPELVEMAVRRNEAVLTKDGALRATTGKFTGRSPKDKYIMVDDHTAKTVHWNNVNQRMSEETFLKLYNRALTRIGETSAFVFDGFGGAAENVRLPIRIVTEYAWHNQFAHQLFLRPTPEEAARHQPAFTVIDFPSVQADPAIHGTNSETCIVISFRHRIVLICGTEYAGEIKKSIFTVLNFLLPTRGVLPMHCSANKDEITGNVTLFFGLSGTGKTTLSADASRRLIGDDEHGWSDDGVFNFEGGCYAKCIGLSQHLEPQIWNAIRFGTVLENVELDAQTRDPDYTSSRLTENTRAAYPLDFIPNAELAGTGGHPNAIIFLTADASGILPPISRLTKEQALYHFLSGYTSKLAGTECGVTAPEPTFSTCFGAPFLPLNAMKYADMLGQKIARHQSAVYLINTGWTGGPYATGSRIKLAYTRRMVEAAVSGELSKTACATDPVFGLAVPTTIAGVPSEVLQPRQTWADTAAYDQAASALAERFAANFEQFDDAPDTVRTAGPHLR